VTFRRPAPSVRRGTWMLVDQALSSFTNFLVSIAVAQLASTIEFGSFSVVLAICYALVELVRPLALEPLLVRFSGATLADAIEARRGTISTALAVGLFSSALMMAASALIDGPVASYFVVGGVAVAAVLTQDGCRFCLIAAGQLRRAAVNDGVWSLVAFAGIALAATTSRNPLHVMLAWSLGGLSAALIGIMQLGVLPTPRSCISWLKSNQNLSPRYVLEYVLDAGGFQVVMLLVGVVGGLEALGALNGARVLLGPVGVLFLAVASFAISEGSRLRDVGDLRLVKKLGWLTVSLAVLPLCWGLVLVVAPPSLGVGLLGPTFITASALLPVLTLYWAARGGLLGAKIGFRISGSARVSLRIMALFSPLVVISSVAGGLLLGAAGATGGLALASTLSAAYSWFRVRQQFPPTLGGTGVLQHK
jgi:O-antigen/teichoic acid export membrane protein